MDESRHIIRTQRIEIDFPSEMDTGGVPHLIGDVFNERILPKMEQLFDQYGGSASLLSFDRLEVDCGTLESGIWEDQLVERTLSQLRERLAQEAVATGGAKSAMMQAAADAWFHFLTRGYVAWDSPVNDLAAFEDVLVVDDVVARRLLDIIRQARVVLDRLLRSFSAPFNKIILAAVTKAAANHVLDSLIKILPAAWRQEEWLQRATLLALAENEGGHQRQAGQEGESLSAYAQQLLLHAPSNRQGQICRAIGAVYGETNAVLGTVFMKQHGGTAIIEALTKEIGRHSEKASRRWEQELAVANNRNAPAQPPVPPGSKHLENRHASAAEGMGVKAAGEDKMVFVENAGLVLVHPFLNPLFETLGWVERGVFTTPEHAGMAALLLQYMAQGDEPMTEAMLPFNKILCGLSTEHFVDVKMLPDAGARHEADNMLGAVIEHWQALKNTSIEGLRETFLSRPGKIEHNGEGWTLHVEGRSLDLLLNQLPWSISIVKMPWNRELLHVNWI